MSLKKMRKTYQASEDGSIAWATEEHQIWSDLIHRQMSIIPDKACAEYLNGLSKLNLPTQNIPQLADINTVLKNQTGWTCQAVKSLIGFNTFFKLLANRRFPMATFIRTREEFDYLQEPDLFHEIFGHCAMLTEPKFAEFTRFIGEVGLNASKQEQVFLARLYWFTVEFGLILNSDRSFRIYGGGILSSPGETMYAMQSTVPERKPFDLIDVLRTPYRIDIMQPIYFYIDSFDQLLSLVKVDLLEHIRIARSLGMHKPKFETKQAIAS